MVYEKKYVFRHLKTVSLKIPKPASHSERAGENAKDGKQWKRRFLKKPESLKQSFDTAVFATRLRKPIFNQGNRRGCLRPENECIE